MKVLLVLLLLLIQLLSKIPQITSENHAKPSDYVENIYRRTYLRSFLGDSGCFPGDVNGDGISDLLLTNSKENRMNILFGSTKYWGIENLNSFNFSSSSFPHFTLLMEPGQVQNMHTSPGRDFNDDGLDDFMYSVLMDGKYSTHLIFGKQSRTSIDVTNLQPGDGFAIQSSNPLEEIGNNLVAAGDMNGDRIADVIIGTHMQVEEKSSYRFIVLFGRKDVFPISLTVNTDEISISNGFFIVANSSSTQPKLAGLGDIDRDGYADIVIGEPSLSRVFLFFGSRRLATTHLPLDALSSPLPVNTLLISADASGSREIDLFGSSVSSAGDFDGDGHLDLIIASSDCIFLIYGRKSWPRGKVLTIDQLLTTRAALAIDPPPFGPSHQFFSLFDSLLSVGDLNHDGLTDILLPY